MIERNQNLNIVTYCLLRNFEDFAVTAATRSDALYSPNEEYHFSRFRLVFEISSLKNTIFFFTLSNAKHEESILIGLAVSSTSKGPQAKTTEPIVSIKITNCSIHQVEFQHVIVLLKITWNLAQRAPFFHLVRAYVCMDKLYVWMDGWMLSFFRPRFFPHQ